MITLTFPLSILLIFMLDYKRQGILNSFFYFLGFCILLFVFNFVCLRFPIIAMVGSPLVIPFLFLIKVVYKKGFKSQKEVEVID